MTPQTSATAAMKWLAYKGWHHDATGQPDWYRGDFAALRNYNGKTSLGPSGLPLDEEYAQDVLKWTAEAEAAANTSN